MSQLELVPPSRKAEAWKYVTPSLLNELSKYTQGSANESINVDSEVLFISSNKIQAYPNNDWKDSLKVIAFTDLNEDQKGSLPNNKASETDSFSSSVYQQSNGLWIEMPKQAPNGEALNITIYTQGDEQIQSTRLHFILPTLSEHKINLHFKGDQAHKYANLSELSFDQSAGSSLKLSVLCEDGTQAMTLTGFQHSLKRDCRLSTYLLNTENRLTRHRLQVDLCEENAEVELVGLGSLFETGSLHHHLELNHLVPHCRSKQLFKTALSGSARSSFDGTIQVAEKAIATEADQLSRYLLLSPNSRANAKPQLKIYADDVVCTHGSTIGQLEEEELFYLQTRGLSREQSHHLLARGFIEEILSEVPHTAFADYWRTSFLDKQFPIHI